MSSEKVNKVKEVLERALSEKRLTQKELARILGISESYVTQLLQEKKIASGKLTRLIEFTFPEQQAAGFTVREDLPRWGEERHPDPQIDAVIRMMEDMDDDTKKDIRLSVEKEKLLRELLRQKEDRAAG